MRLAWRRQGPPPLRPLPMTSDTALLDEPTVDTVPARRERRWLGDLIGCLVVCLVVLAGYHDVAFGGKTFSSSAQTRGGALGGEACGTPNGVCEPVTYDDPRVDIVASAWQLEPWARINHSSLADREVPLWNDYEGAGLPLAANMQSAVFDPLLAALHLHPTLLVQDVMFLIGLALIGLGAYAAARSITLRPLAATAAGSVFGLSGWFFVYSNSHWFRTYLYLGFLVACVEWTLRSNRWLPVLLTGASIAGMVVIGMPEPTFMALVAAGVYSLIRVFSGPRVHDRWRAVGRLALGGVLGLALAAPLLVTFGEYLPLSQNTHAALAGKPPATDPKSYFLNWLMPKISPDVNRAMAGTRTWVGAGAFMLAVCALASPKALRKYVGWPIAALGALVAIQIYGGSLVAWTRVVPYWSQVLWPTFGTPIIAFCIALLAGIGVQAISDHALNRRLFVLLTIALVSVVIVAAMVTPRIIALAHDVKSRGGWPLALVVSVVVVVVVLLIRAPRLAAGIVTSAIIIELLLLAPSGFAAPRANPYPTRTWISFLQDRTASDGARVFSPDGLLFPDTAGVYGLRAPTMLDALYIERYWDYLSAFVAHGLVDRYLGTGPYEPATNVAGNQMFDLLGIRYVMYDDETGNAPPSWSGDQYQPVFRGDGVTVYENTHSAPRAFIVHRIARAASRSSSLAFLRKGERNLFPDRSIQVTNKDMRSIAVIESDAESVPAVEDCTDTGKGATVVEHSSDSVTLDVDTSCAGLLVLGDSYYPGWEARVNGDAARIYATDVALRGVAVPRGHSRVEFRYRPHSFRLGVAVFLAAIVAIISIALIAGFRSPWWQQRSERRSRVAALDPPPSPGRS